MASSGLQLRSLYRTILRELPPLRPAGNLLPSATKSYLFSNQKNQPPVSRLPVHVTLRQCFQEEMILNNDSPTPTPQQASHLMRYLKSQRIYVELLEQYNPMLTMEDKERIRLTARRVGLDLPKTQQ